MGRNFSVGRYTQSATPADIAATLASVLNIQAPSCSIGRILSEAMRTTSSKNPRAGNGSNSDEITASQCTDAYRRPADARRRSVGLIGYKRGSAERESEQQQQLEKMTTD